MLLLSLLFPLLSCDPQNIFSCRDASCLRPHNGSFIDFWRKPSTPFRPWNIWTDHQVVLTCHKNCRYMLGDTVDHITAQIGRQSWLKYLLGRPFPTHRVGLPPHAPALVGVMGDGPYSLLYLHRSVHPVYVLLVTAGLLLLLDWEGLARSWVVHYLCGLLLGVLGITLFLSYFVLKPIPNSSIFVAGKVTLGTFLGHYVWSVLTSPTFLGTYWRFILAYLALVVSATSAYLYYRGPVQSARVLDIFGFAVRIVGLFLLYCGTNSTPGSLLLLLVALFCLVFPWSRLPLPSVSGQSPPQNSLLVTREEHRREIVQNTRSGLAELRDYCRSLPSDECWRIINSMSNPATMASFVMGENDISLDHFKYDSIE